MNTGPGILKPLFFYRLSGKKPMIRTTKNILANQHGIALLVTLSIITIFLTVSLELNRRVRKNIEMTDMGKIRARLMETAESGIVVAKAMLLKDAAEKPFDSVQEDWADPEKIAEILHSSGYDNEKLTLAITDEMGKIQVNALIKSFPGNEVNPDQKKIWENLLSFFISKDKSEDDRDPGAIINCLIDWLDSGDDDAVSGISGAESDYYESLDPPYACANKPFDDLSELFLVKGISTDLLKKAENLKSLLPDPEDGSPEFELADLFTVFGVTPVKSAGTHRERKKYAFTGTININTAPVPVIAALLPFGKQDLALKIAEFRTERFDEQGDFVNNLEMKGWYARIAGLTQEEKARMDNLIVYASHIFSIASRASMNGQSLTIKTVVARQKDSDGQWQCKTLRQMIE
jgi:general secretion pathway protein K